MTSVALAQSAGDAADADASADVVVIVPDLVQPGATTPVPDQDQAPFAQSLFLRLVDPAEQDVEVPLDTAQLIVQGVTLPGAVVSVDGDLVDTDDQGSFIATTALDEGANEIDVVASDADGNQISTTLFVVRGE